MAEDVPGEKGPSQKELEQEDEINKQIAQMTVNPSYDEVEERCLPSIDEVLMSYESSAEARTLVTLPSPGIVVTSPEGVTSADYESQMGKSVLNADAAIAFGTNPWGMGVAAVKVADLVTKRLNN